MANVPRGLVLAVGLGLVVSATTAVGSVGDSGRERSPVVGRGKGVVSAASQKVPRKKNRTRKSATAEDATPAPEASAAPVDGEMKFSRDVAPIFVANCLGCHNPTQKRKNLDLTTFEKIMEGTPEEKVVVPGKPEESHLVLRLKGLETPKMPQGANRKLSEEAIGRVERWVKAGAVLDAGVDPKALLAKYAATPEDLRKSELAKMSADQRDKQVEAAGLARWKKANPKVTPQVTPGTHFLLFGTLPKARAAAALKTMESQYAALRNLLGPAPLEWGEKASFYVFNDVSTYNEFVRVVETREVESGDKATASFKGPQPYVAVVDPLGGRDEPAGTPKRGGRSKHDDSAADRSLAGVLTEPFAAGVLAHAGKPPRWLALGVGAHLASRVEPRNPYYAKIRREAFDLFNQGWVSRANDALGDGTKAEDERAVGLAVVEWLNATDRSILPDFVKGMLAGGDKLDDVVGTVLNGNRADFLAGSGMFVSGQYGAGR